MRTLFPVFSLLLLALSAPALADKIYRWTDDSGQTHFGSQPPMQGGKNVEEYNVRVTPAAAGTKPYQIETGNKKEEAQEEAEAKQPAISKEEADRNCKQAQEYKTQISSNFSRRYKQEDGEYRPLSDEQRASEIKKADEMIALYCNRTYSNKTRQ